MGFPEQVIADGAIAYWRLNDSASPAVSQVGTFPGTIAGGVTLQQPGAMSGGKSMLFDGSTGRIDMGDIAAFELPSGTLTLAGWIRFTDMTAQRIIAGKSDFGATYKGWTLFQNQASAGNIRLFVRDAASATISDTVTNLALNNGAWRFIAVTVGANWAPANVNWYIDGVPAGKTVLNGAGGTADANAQPFRIGAPSNGVSASNNWNGSIADFAIYASVLTAAQIANQFNLATGGQGGAPGEFRSRYRLRDAA